ncbi:MAG TPA: NUDIX hydrolase [Rhizomicrobium sp.]|jgi:nudix-type nucleoside diphosphatase (YffH/AdpP family)|nr:NUDIX hydrolase [Rhizomicrobium sp.]
MAAKIVGVRPVYKGWATISIATVEKDGQSFERLMEDHGPGVCALAIDRQRKVAIMVRQFRAPVAVTSGETDLLECPAGLMDSEEPERDVRRELAEETGLRVAHVEHVATVWTMPGISTERMHMYFAWYARADRTGKGGGQPSEHENITAEEVALSELAAMADDGRMADMKTFLLIQTLRLREPALFA